MQAVSVPAKIDTGNAAKVLESLREAAAGPDPLALDLAPLQEFDSAALSLLLQLAREGATSGRAGRAEPTGESSPVTAREQSEDERQPAGQRLLLLNPPQKLQELAQLYGVAEMLFGTAAVVGNSPRSDFGASP